ncbi:MAG: amino acid adenylation domain-containing protein [Xenococcaceae cyanobacterium MO_167.B27]|nr:amino acid adenylation domain-containing protein [Xenococcaceae cyanobacterium MO_167.B27]
MTNIYDRIAKLPPAKRKLLEQKLKQRNISNSQREIIPDRDRQSKIPLSSAQMRMWLLDKFDPGNPAYNRPTNLSLIGKLELQVLQQSINEIIRRHEILRTSFPADNNGIPKQKIHNNLTLDLPVINLSNLSDAEQENKVTELAIKAAKYTFDLSKLPLIQASILKLKSNEHILLLNFHHIIFDGWSAEVFLTELNSLYAAFIPGKLSPLPELSIQYADFAIWQQKQLKDGVFDSQLAYWQQQLQGELPVLDLPTDRPRGGTQTFNGGRVCLNLSPEITKSLKALSLRDNTTLYMTLLAAFKVLLYRYTNQQDIIIGSPIAGRDRAKTEFLIGIFINTLAIRTKINPDLTFKQFLAQICQITLDAQSNKDIPFDKLIETLNIQRNININSVFQVLFQLRNMPKAALSIPDLEIKNFYCNLDSVMLDLALEIEENNNKLLCIIKYNSDLFNSITIERMAGHFQTILEGIVTQPDSKIQHLPLLTQAEKQQILIDWNNSKADYPQDKCIHQLFEAQVAKTPDAIAVVYKDKKLTYRELNNRANQFAHYLQSLGVKPETLVGICIERSLEMVISLLGILKAGGAYLPLDPNYPQERLDYILKDSQIEILITKFHLHNSSFQCQSVICLDTDWHQIATYSQENVVSEVKTNNLVYVIYTSGSTGKPKGVAIEHQSLVNFVQAAIAQYQITHSDTILQFASIGFDTAIEEIYTCLTVGATLVLRTEEMLSSSAKFLKQCQTWNITVLDLPTAYWHQLTNDLTTNKLSLPPSLRLVIIGGEKALAYKVALWQQYVGDYPELINTYGPTESTVVTTAYKITTNTATDIDIPIGKPLANLECYILDRNLQLLPMGIPGELYITGKGLSRGYLNPPELTREKFINNPFNTSSILYKTGDKALYLADGNIQFLGRVDNQVKIRGFRVELGEIEAILLTYSLIKETVVISTEVNPGDLRLVAYYVPNQAHKVEIEEIRNYLSSRLPEYAIPSVFISLDTLPLTTNGKIDRRNLPNPDFTVRQTDKNYIAPSTEIETQLAKIWTNVLKLDRISIEDNFFNNLGGHSLLAVQLVSRISQKLKIELSLNKIFEFPTIRELSQEIARLEKTNSEGIIPRAREDNLPLSFAQSRLWFLEQLEPGKSTYNIPFAFRILGALNITALNASLNQILQRHEVLRTSLIAVEGETQQVITPHIKIDIPVIDLSNYGEAKAETQAQQIVQEVARETFDITFTPLLKVKLIRLNKHQHWLVINIHHIAFDGWSKDIFYRELSALYSAYCNSDTPPLRPLPIQYADFAYWQRQYLQQDNIKYQFTYWRNKLAGDLPRLQLPTDYPRPKVISYKGAREIFEIDAELATQLKQLSQQQESTLFMTLLTAFKVLLHRYTNQTDIIVGSPIAGRNQPEIADLIGFFVNTLVLRSQVNPEENFTTLLNQVKQTALQAYEHQDIPFEKLVEELKPQRDSRYTPLFHVAFMLQNASETLTLSDLEVTPLNLKQETAKFDLALYLEETTIGIKGRISYSTDLFKATTIQRMVSHFQILLQGIVTQPTQAIYQLPLLTEAEQQQILVNWNQTQTNYPQKSINKLFEIQVTKNPDSIALVYNEQKLTYQQLNSKANQLGRYLQSVGIQSGDTVGICLERSCDSIISLLAILKTGGVYLPLDTTYPQERLNFMLSEPEVKVLLTNTSLSHRFDNQFHNRICIDRDWDKIAQQPDNNLDKEVKPDDLAYIMYTSGSTGKPKGVCIKHRGVVRLVKNTNYAQFDSQQVFLQLAPISFDAATLEIWGSLLNGAKLILYPERTPTLEKLAQIIQQHQVTFLWLTAALFHLVVDEHITALQPIKQLLAGGDVLSVPHVQKVLENLDNCQLINGYGPTENTTFTCCYPIHQLDENCTSIPIGKPIANTQVYILDSYLQPVPIGIPGELYIAGDGLAQSYFNRPRFNQERFINNPYGPGKLYKTGDLVRYLDNGNLEFIGRIDNQVKIRGFRLELGEIEAMLVKHPQIKDAIVLAKEAISGDKKLVAYLISNENNQPSSKQLQEFLANNLPSYMIPRNYLFLKQFPLSPNGKVQRQALPTAKFNTTELAPENIAPRNYLEAKLAQIWQQILNVPAISVKDDFFAIGGNSLLSIRLVSAVETAFKQKIPVSTFFQLSTIEQLAEAIDKLQQKPTTREKSLSSISNSFSLYKLTEKEQNMLLASTIRKKRALGDKSLVMLEKSGNPNQRKPLFFVYLLGDLAKHLPTDLPVYNLTVWTKVERPETFVKALAAHYVQEIRKIQPEGEYYIGGYCVGGYVALEIARQLQAQGQKVANLTLIQTKAFDPVYQHYQAILLKFGYKYWLKALNYANRFKKYNSQEKITSIQNILTKVVAKISSKFAAKPTTQTPSKSNLQQANEHYEAEILNSLKSAMAYYRPESYSGKVTLFLARQGTLYSPLFLQGGWNNFFQGELNTYIIPGNHTGINKEPNVISLVQKLNQHLTH